MRKKIASLVLALLTALVPAAVASPLVLDHRAKDLAERLRAVDRGSVVLEELGEGLGALEIEPVEIFAPGAGIRLHAASGVRELPFPEQEHFRGRIAGQPGSMATLNPVRRRGA